MKRRIFLGLGAMMPAALLTSRAAQAQRAGCNVTAPATIPLRPSGPVEVAYKAPHGQPNGMCQGPEPGQLWVQDRGRGRQVTLIRAADGGVIREIQADAIGPSGIGADEDGTMWTSDTHGVMLVNFAAADGATLGKYFVPGATRIYEKVGDAPFRNSPLKRAYPDESRALGDSLRRSRECGGEARRPGMAAGRKAGDGAARRWSRGRSRPARPCEASCCRSTLLAQRKAPYPAQGSEPASAARSWPRDRENGCCRSRSCGICSRRILRVRN